MKKGGMLMKTKRFGFVPVIVIVLGITLIGLSVIDPGPALGWPGEPTPDQIVIRTPAPPLETRTPVPVLPDGASLSYCEVIVDDLDSGFQLYGPSGGWHHSGSSDTTHNGHAYWTYCTDTWEGSSVNNWATWTPNLPETRQWEVLAYIPYVNTGRYDTGRARYQIHTASGDYVVERDQDNNTGWVSLGTYTFNAGTSGYVRLEDVTPDWYFIYGGQSYRKTIKLDAIKWSRCQSPGASVSISVDRGEGAIYYVGDPISVCYSVSRPIYVKIYDCPPGQSCYVMLEGYDDGTGGCIYGTIIPPTGWETVRIEGIENNQVVAEDETYFFVTDEVETEPPPGYCRVHWINAISNECSGEFGLYYPQQIMLFSNYKYRPLPDVVQFGPFNPGTSLVFYIRPWSFCGPAEYLSTSANAHITNLGTNRWRIDWEDLPPDRADDYNDLVVEVECGIDNEAPSIFNVVESNDPIYKQGCPSPTTVQIAAGITDPSGVAWAKLYYRLNYGSWNNVTMSHSDSSYYTTIGPFSETGTVEYYVKARDNVGNESSSSTNTVTVQDCDITPPYIFNVVESNDPIYKQGCPSPTTVEIAAGITDSSGVAWAKLYYRLNYGSWNNVTMSHSDSSYYTTIGPFSETGTVEYYIKARDNVGNEGDSSTNTLTVRDCPSEAPNGLDVSKLQLGDVLMVNPTGLLEDLIDLYGGYWGHTAMYIGERRIVESTSEGWPSGEPGVQVLFIDDDDSSFWTSEDWVVLHVNTLFPIIKEEAVQYAIEQANNNIPYNFEVWNKYYTNKFYCSQLVWRSYYQSPFTSVDLDSDESLRLCYAKRPLFRYLCDQGLANAVPPDDIFYDDNIADDVYARRCGGPSDVCKRATVSLDGTAHLYISGPQGRHTGVRPTTGLVVEEIPGVLYYSGPNGELEYVVIQDLEGTWNLQVIGTENGSYTLTTEVVDRGEGHQIDYVTQTTSPGKVDEYPITYPTIPGEPIRLTGYTIYLPLIIENYP